MKLHLIRILIAAALLALGLAPVAAAGPAGVQSLDKPAPRADADSPLASSFLREAVEELAQGGDPDDLLAVGERVRVEILHEEGLDIAATVASVGGSIYGQVPGVLVEALVPYDRLAELEGLPGIVFVGQPLDASIPLPAEAAQGEAGLAAESAAAPIVGQEVAKTNAAAWHAAGFTGQGVKVGIVDYFDASLWTAAQQAGELPAPAGIFCRSNGVSCNIWGSGSSHGEGVAEIVHEQAPSAQLYLATTSSTSDLQAAVDWFAANGVTIITRSLTAEYDGAGNGTGPLARVIDNAVARGITWFNSAGNSAGSATRAGSYWRGVWRDPDGDGWLDFATGDELLDHTCGFANGLRWSDWNEAGATDYDVYVYDDAAATTLEARIENRQTAGAPPVEIARTCREGDTDYLAIRLHSAGAGTADDVLELMVNRGWVQYSSNPYSASGPASDTVSAGALSVGAIDPAVGTTIAVYSSNGPTNDGRIKPDLSAAACVSSFTVQPCFNGTSAATPVAAGAAALVVGARAATTPAQVKSYLLGSVQDRGVAGRDNVYGEGELVLRSPATGGGDTVAPTATAPVVGVAPGAQLGASAIPVRLTWSGADTGGSGLAGYTLWQSTDGSAYAQVTLPSALTTSIVRSLAPGRTYSFVVGAVDGAGNRSAWAYGAGFALDAHQETSGAIAYTGTWTRFAWAPAYGGYERTAKAAGATAKLTFTGRNVAWVAPTAANRGRAYVYVDGVHVKTLDLYSATTVARKVVFTQSWATSGKHTLAVRVVGTSGRPSVDVDAFVVLR